MPPISAELLVRYGLFPENLPSIFTTRAIWPQLPPVTASYAVTTKAVGELCTYDASKRGGQRRIFGIRHPLFIRDQGIFFERHWTEIEHCFEAATGSTSHPIIDPDGPRHIRITPHSELPRIRLTRLSRFAFCLVADVSRCFYSIYSHSIPWAIHGKTASKSDTDPRSATVFGNRLDYTVRQAQSRQTMGVPVGPDSSKIIAEIVMSAVDKRFIELSGTTSPTYVRHVDDYWIGGRTHDECERHLTHLRLALNDFSLDINELKTRIISTKFVFGETWPSQIERAISENLKASDDGADPVPTLGMIVERAVESNDDGIIKNAIRVIDRKRLWSEDWDLLEHFLAQCAVQFPHSFDYVARVIAWRIRVRSEVNRELWLDIARSTAIRDGSLGRDSEVCWSIWLLRELGSRLPKSITDVIAEHASPLVLAFLVHFTKHRLANDRQLVDKLRNRVDGDPFAGPYWPLTLELTHIHEEDRAWAAASTVEPLRTLHGNRISIIDWSAVPRVFEIHEEDGPRPRYPDYAIEDIGSDYPDHEEEEEEVLHPPRNPFATLEIEL
jgi:hypothetical protein